MNLSVLLSAIIAWVLLLIVAILNAGLRTNILDKKLSELRSHQASSLIFMSLLLVGSVVFAMFMSPIATLADLMVVGLMWMLSTIIFEFMFGHYVMKHSWQRLIDDYNLLKGRLWLLILVVILVGPVLGGLMVGY
jgi:hypothetical protein